MNILEAYFTWQCDTLSAHLTSTISLHSHYLRFTRKVDMVTHPAVLSSVHFAV